MSSFVINIESGKAKEALDALAQKCTNLTPLMTDIKTELLSQTEQAFVDEGPNWAPLKQSTIAERIKKGIGASPILQRSGHLARSVVGNSGENYAEVGVSAGDAAPYAAIHQFGGTTSPHKITAKDKKALSFGGIIRKSVNHPGSTIPARAYLPFRGSGADAQLTEKAETAIIDLATDYLSAD